MCTVLLCACADHSLPSSARDDASGPPADAGVGGPQAGSRAGGSRADSGGSSAGARGGDAGSALDGARPQAPADAAAIVPDAHVDLGPLLHGDEFAAPAPSGVPLLERKGKLDRVCLVTREVTVLPTGSAARLSAAELDGAAHIVWSDPSSPQGWPDGPLKIARVGSDGTLQPAATVFMPAMGSYILGANAFPGHGQLTLWWNWAGGGPAPAQQGTLVPSTGLIRLDAAMKPLAPERSFDSAQFPMAARLLATADGYAAVWTESTPTGCTLQRAELDQALARDGEPVTLATKPSVARGGAARYPTCAIFGHVATPRGIGLVYARGEGTQDVIAYQAFDAGGRALGPATRLTPPDTFPSGLAMIARGDEVLVAWAVPTGPNRDDETNASLRLVRFGADGRLRGEVATLAAASGQIEGASQFVDFGDAVGLVWSRRHRTDPDCTRGCSHSGSVHYVLLDGTDLAPRSVALELSAPDAAMGISAWLAVRAADEVQVLIDQWKEVSYMGSGVTIEPGASATATILCRASLQQ